MAKRFAADYTADDIMALYKQRSREGDEERIRSLAATFRSLTRLELEPSIPPEYAKITRAVKTPFVRDAHHRITSSLVAKPPVIHITPRDDKRQEFRDAASIAERFDLAMIERINKETGKDIIFNLTAALVRDGESVLGVFHRPDAFANFPEGLSVEEQETWKRGVDLPIAWTDIDRMRVVYEGGEFGDDWVIEYGEYTKNYLKTKYGMTERDNRLVDPKRSVEGKGYPEGLSPTSRLHSVKVQFFNSREWHVLVDGTEAPGWPRANPYAPYLPYFRASAYESESLLYSLMFLVPRLDELLTMKLNWAYLGAYPNPVLETVPNTTGFPALDGPVGNSGDATAAGTQVLTWRPGKLMDLPIGRRLSFLVPPPVGQDINELITIFKSLVDIAGVPSIMRGMAGAGDSGYLANQLRAAAEMAYKLAALAMQRQLEKATEFSHWIISKIVRQTVYVLGWQELNPKTGKANVRAGNAWLGLSPDRGSANIGDLSKLGPISFAYRPTLATDEQARAMIALQLTNAATPLYDVRHALENYMQEEDADAIIEAIALQRAMQAPEIEAMVRKKAMQNAGLLPPEQPAPSGGNGLVDQYGNPMQSGLAQGGPISPGMQGVPLANQAPPGMPGIPGLTMPISPPEPQGVPGNVGGREAGMYPGQPGGPNQ